MNNNSFRQKVSYKFTLKINPINNSKKDNKNTDKPMSIKRLPLPIPAKSPKEVNEILKYFKTISPTKLDNNQGKSYAQASKSSNTAKKILKIKKVFPSLKADKINNIQKIINRGSKLKPRINMTTKSPSKKQIIIPMNNYNKTKFMEDSAMLLI